MSDTENGYQSCEHTGAEFTQDTNEMGTIILFFCPDCGFSGGMHPKEFEKMAAQGE